VSEFLTELNDFLAVLSFLFLLFYKLLSFSRFAFFLCLPYLFLFLSVLFSLSLLLHPAFFFSLPFLFFLQINLLAHFNHVVHLCNFHLFGHYLLDLRHFSLIHFIFIRE